MPETMKKPAAKAADKKTAGAKKPAAVKSAAKKRSDGAKKSRAKQASSAKKPQAKKPASGAKKPQAKKTTGKRPVRSTGKATTGRKAGAARKSAANPVANAANRRQASRRAKPASADLFMESRPARKKGGTPPSKPAKAPFRWIDFCLAAAIVVMAILAIHQQSAYAEFLRMRAVVDQQTFYEGTTVEGVDVSGMTLANAIEYWRDRVEARYEARTVTFDDGTAVTAAQLGYSSDYEAVLYAAWSAGRSGSLEERYMMASHREKNPVAYQITRVNYSDALLEEYVRQLAVQIDRPVQEATIASFSTDTYEFEFNPAQPGADLDTDALKVLIVESLEHGGGSVSLPVTAIAPTASTEEVASQYGLIDYAITNASSSSKARLNNIRTAMSYINGTCVKPGEIFSFNDTVGRRTTERGVRMATAYSGGDVTEQVGGGICQVSTTLFNAAVKADMEIVERHSHSLTVHYVDKGKDATVDWGNQDLKFKNTSDDNVYICCYLTDDRRVRFGIFGKRLPNGEKITLESVITEVVEAKTEYQQSVFLGPGETHVLQEGRNGYKAEAYKVRWDAEGHQISKELLCKSSYKVKDEIIQYGV